MRIAQSYSHTLRSDLIAELNRLRAKERALRAALARRDAAIQAAREQMIRERDSLRRAAGLTTEWFGYDKCLELIDAALSSALGETE
jgi:hypothetical protein